VVNAEADLMAAQAQVRAILGQVWSLRWKLQTAMEEVDNQVALLRARVAVLKSEEATHDCAKGRFYAVGSVVEANLMRLNEEARLAHVAELIARKLAGPEQSVLDDSDLEFHQREYERLLGDLEASYQASSLPESPSARLALNDLLMRLRLGRSTN
jgi:hypothetical protein